MVSDTGLRGDRLHTSESASIQCRHPDRVRAGARHRSVSRTTPRQECNVLSPPWAIQPVAAARAAP